MQIKRMSVAEHERLAETLYSILLVGEGDNGVSHGIDFMHSFFGKAARPSVLARAVYRTVDQLRDELDAKWSAEVRYVEGGDWRRPAPCYYDRRRDGLGYFSDRWTTLPYEERKTLGKTHPRKFAEWEGAPHVLAQYACYAKFMREAWVYLSHRFGKTDAASVLAGKAARQARELVDSCACLAALPATATKWHPNWDCETHINGVRGQGGRLYPAPWRYDPNLDPFNKKEEADAFYASLRLAA
jgi:hypothetical protein